MEIIWLYWLKKPIWTHKRLEPQVFAKQKLVREAKLQVPFFFPPEVIESSVIFDKYPWVITNISITPSVKKIWQYAVESCRHFFVFGAHQGKTIPYVIANWFSVHYYHKEMFRFHSRGISSPWYQFIIYGIIRHL